MEMVKGFWFKFGCVVIDVGINVKDDLSKKCGYCLVGDVEYDFVVEVVGYIIFVSGGVGLMIIAILL